MMDEKLSEALLLGFYTIKANKREIKGPKRRELIEVLHDESTVTYALEPVTTMAGVVKVTKAMIDGSR